MGTLAKRSAGHGPALSSLLILVVVALLVCAFCLRMAHIYLDHPLHSLDGAFQTYNAVQAFSQGAALGQDFQSYLGVTSILTLVPVFMMLGGTLFASTAAASLAVFSGLLLSVYILVRLAGLRSRPRSFLLSALIVSIVYSGANGWFGLLAFPGNSLRPLRWALPFLLAAPAHALFRRALGRRERGDSIGMEAASLGALGGLGLTWSNDIGLPTLLSLLGALLLLFWHRLPWTGLVSVALTYIGMAGACFALIVLAVTQGHPIDWLVYNFRDVPSDQFWLFSPWEESGRVFQLADLHRLFGNDLILSAGLVSTLVCGTVCVVTLLRRRHSPVRFATLAFVLGASAGGAIVPQIGGHIEASYAGGTLLPGLIAPFAFRGTPLAIPYLDRLKALLGQMQLSIAAIATLIVLNGYLAVKAVTFMPSRTGATYDESLGAFIPADEARTLTLMRELDAQWDAAAVHPERRLFSDYYSALNLVLGARSPTPYPTIIHALGADAKRRFARPVESVAFPLGTTIAPDYSGWAAWNMRANWYFFRAVLKNYRPVARTEQHVFWRPASGSIAFVAAICEVVARRGGATMIEVHGPAGAPPGSSWLVELELHRAGPPTRNGRGFIAIDEVVGPLQRNPARIGERWPGYPRYGASLNAPPVFVTEVEAGRATLLMVSLIPARRQLPLWDNVCRARAVPSPQLVRLPRLTRLSQLGLTVG